MAENGTIWIGDDCGRERRPFKVTGPGHYMSSYSVVIAYNQAHAIRLVDKELTKHGIASNTTRAFTVERINDEGVHVLFNGDY